MDNQGKVIGKIKCWLGIHNWLLVSTERSTIRLFKKLYEVNGWNPNYKTSTYECSRCKEREVINE